MNKEEILKMAQTENRGKDVADLDAQRRGAYFAYLVGICLIVAVDIIEGIVLHRISFGCNMAMFVMAFVAFLTKFRIRGKKHELFVAIAYGIGAVVWTVLWIMQLRSGAEKQPRRDPQGEKVISGGAGKNRGRVAQYDQLHRDRSVQPDR